MWSRISDLAVKIDSKFGDVDGVSPEDSGGATPSSGADEEEEEEVEAEEGTSSGMGDEDGWGDDDGFGDDLEFGENDDGRGPSLEDGNIDDDPSREGGGGSVLRGRCRGQSRRRGGVGRIGGARGGTAAAGRDAHPKCHPQ